MYYFEVSEDNNTRRREDGKGKTGREKADSMGDGRSKAAGDPIRAYGEPETVNCDLSGRLVLSS